MDHTGLDPRTVASVLDTDSPVTVADITMVGEALVHAYPEGLTMPTLIPAVQLMLRMSNMKAMPLEKKRQFIIDVLRYVVDNTNAGPTLEQLDEVIKQLIPSAVDAFLQHRSGLYQCCCLK